MRKITKESSEAFVNFKSYKKDNTEVEIQKVGYKYDEIATFYLHGNRIAEITRVSLPEYQRLKSTQIIDLCGWHTPTTRERINGILDALGYDFRIAQRNHEQVLVRNRRWKFHDNGGWEESYSQDILKLSDDSFDPELAKKVFLSSEFVSGTDLNAIADF
tara:strand:+ start:98 stop:577 length:480 start_codon:yes stop_codon:yes gene_type:complete